MQRVTSAIAFDGVCLSYGNHIALDDAAFTIEPGTLTALIGPNGSGKSTLMDAVAGLVTPHAGQIAVQGRPMTGRQPDVSYVMQQTAANRLLPMTVAEVTLMGRYATRGMFGRLSRADRAAATRAMQDMDVLDLRHRQLRELSGGQRQRVLVAQGLAQDAAVLLLDEPVTGLDILSQQLITQAMAAQRAAGRTVVISTHDLREAEAADHVVLLAGRVIASGPPHEVLTSRHLREAYGTHLITLGPDQHHIDEHVHPHDDGHDHATDEPHQH